MTRTSTTTSIDAGQPARIDPEGGIRFALGLGANLGDREATLAAALVRLNEALGPLDVAPLYRTAPVSPIPQPDYLNTAATGTTRRPPDEILAIAKALELAAGRRLGPHRGPRLGPRALDVDLLVYGARVSEAPELTLPHPGLARRRFVLAPLADVAPDLPVPPGGRTVAELLAACDDPSPVERIG
jgi:2-amino-4-hydroxy-6-hydroxymethyldihydropteridine diphosphokinase